MSKPSQADVMEALKVLAAADRAAAQDREAAAEAAEVKKGLRRLGSRSIDEVRAECADVRGRIESAKAAGSNAERGMAAAEERLDEWGQATKALRRVGASLSVDQQSARDAVKAELAAHKAAYWAASKAASKAEEDLQAAWAALQVAKAREVVRSAPAFSDPEAVEQLRALLREARRAAFERARIADGAWYDHRSGSAEPDYDERRRMNACSAREEAARAEIRAAGVDPDLLPVSLVLYDAQRGA